MESPHAILLVFHVSPDAGYAIDTLRAAFLEMARRLVVDPRHIHVSFPNLEADDSVQVDVLPSNIIEDAADAESHLPEEAQHRKYSGLERFNEVGFECISAD